MKKKSYKNPIFISQKGADEHSGDTTRKSLLILREVSYAENATDFDFSDKFISEKSVFLLVKQIGFDLNFVGTEYLIALLNFTLNSMNVLNTKKKMYQEIANVYTDVTVLEIEKALKICIQNNIKLGEVDLYSTNSCEDNQNIIVKNDDLFSFLTAICTRFLMLKTHKMGLNFFE